LVDCRLVTFARLVEANLYFDIPRFGSGMYKPAGVEVLPYQVYGKPSDTEAIERHGFYGHDDGRE
jgi:hypothetical protein